MLLNMCNNYSCHYYRGWVQVLGVGRQIPCHRSYDLKNSDSGQLQLMSLWHQLGNILWPLCLLQRNKLDHTSIKTTRIGPFSQIHFYYCCSSVFRRQWVACGQGSGRLRGRQFSLVLVFLVAKVIIHRELLWIQRHLLVFFFHHINLHERSWLGIHSSLIGELCLQAVAFSSRFCHFFILVVHGYCSSQS